MFRFPLAALILALTATGCADAAGPDADPYVGTYSLVSVDGQSLPALILEANDDSFELVDGSFTLRENGYYHSAVSIRVVEEGVETVFPAATTGTYDATGAHFSFISREGAETSATLTENRLVVTQDEVVMTFAR